MAPGVGVVLVGYRGSGKTTVGRLVASRLGLPFVDCDEAVERGEGMEIAEIFRLRGEKGFRELERECIARLTASGQGGVLATGGGVILDPRNVEDLKRFGTVVFLETSAAELRRRLRRSKGRRPPLVGDVVEEVDWILARRTPLYHSAADHVVVTDGRSVEEVAEAVVRLLRP